MNAPPSKTALVIAMSLFAGATLLAQTNVGNISGKVFDTSGAVVPNCSVLARNLQTGFEQSTLTDDSGSYSFPSLPRGTPHERMNLQFHAESFNTWNHPSFTNINTTVRFNAAGQPIQNYGAASGSGPGRVLSFGLKLIY